jgi:hypothetical protein
MSTTRAPKPFRAFLSYSSKDKKFAGRIKHALEPYNIDAFLAHEDIAPAANWQQTIEQELKRCDAFIPLITKENFHASYWTDQECGFALARARVILPICSRNPYGFLEKYQAYKRKPGKNEEQLIEDVLVGLASHKSARNRFLATLISALRTSSGFDQSVAICRVLARISQLSKVQMAKLLRSAIAQPQVHKSAESVKHLRQLIKKNSAKVEKSLLHKFEKKVAKYSR